MLALTEDAIHEVIWTETLLAEWERVIVGRYHRSAESAASITAAIREFFPEGQIPEADYALRVDDMPGNDPDDRRHMAAAVAGQARVIVTWNRADFPAQPLATMGLRVADPDTYLSELLSELPREVAATVVRMAGEKRRPPRTPTDLTNDLARAGVPNFAERLRAVLGQAGEPAS
jgi:predicted nucleic acid-binding protein